MPFDVLEPETTSQGYELIEPENKGYEIIEPEVGMGQVDLSHTKGPLEEAPPSPPKPSYSLGDYAKAGLQILDLPRFKVSQIPEAVRQFQAEPAINYQIPPVEQVKPTIAERLAIPPAIQQIVGPENAAQIGRTLVNIPLGVGEFLTTSPMGITTMASARTIPGITGAYFFQDMARSFATQAAQTYKDWDKMSTPQKIDATLKVASSALLAGALGVHTAGRIKQVVSGEPAAPAPNTEQTAGIGGNVHPVLGAEVLGWPRLVETVRSLFSVPVGEKKTAAIVPPLVEQQQSLPLHTQQQQPEEGVLNAESIRASEGQLPQTRVEPQGVQEAGGNVVEQKPPGQPEPVVQGGQPQAQGEVLLTPEAKPSLSDQGTAPEAPAPSAAVGESGTGVVEQPATQPPAISEAKPLVENTQVTQTMPPEQSIGGALPEEITKPGTYVSNMFAAIDRDRAEMGKPPMEATKRRTWDEDNAKALARMNKDPEWIPNLLAAMTVEPRPMLSWEIAGTVWQRAKWKAEIHNAERRIELAIKDNRPTDLAEAQEVRKKFEGAIELLDQTVGRNGTASEAGRTLQAQKMATGEDFDLVELRLKRVADKGRQLTDAEVKETEEKVAKPYKKVTEKLAETEEKAQEAKDENGFKDTVAKAKQERPRPEDNVKSLQTKLGERLTEDPEYDIYPIVKRLVKVLIDTEGITTREPMYDRVHQILQEVIPNLTRREVIDAVGGYNRPIDLPMDVVSVIYRDLRGQSQQVSKLADMAKGEAPKRTGLQRGEMSDEQRRLVKQVEEAKRLGGYKVTDPARQLRTALQAAKTAVEHQIADLSKEIATKERILKTKTQMVPDQELLDLRAKRDALKAEHKAIFGERVLTPEQKAKMAEAALDRQIAEVQRQLETGEVFPPTRTPAPMPSTPGIEAKLQTLAELKLQRYYERERIQPSRTPEVQAVNKFHAAMKAAETRMVNQLASLEAQLAKRVKNVRPSRVVIENAKIVELRARIADLKKTYDAVFRPPPYTDAKRLEIWKERTQDKIESYKKRIEEKDLARKPRPQEPNLDREAMDLRFELEKVHRVWMEMRAQDMLEKQTKLQKAIRHTIDTSNSVRALMTSFDLSAVLRQGKFIVAGHPIRGAKSFVPMLQAMWSPEAQYRINAEIRRRPNAPLYDRAGLYLAEHGGRLVQAEEAFMAKGIEKVPIVGRGVLASGRAYTTFLNKLRADSFDIMAKTLSQSGDVTLDQAKAIANYINVATGRGAGFQQGAAGLNAVFFAPRFVASRFQALALQPLWKGDWRTRKLIAKEYARFATGIAVVYALGLAAGATVETDRRSSDFGKLKFGNTRVDPLAGLGQVAVLTKRLLGGETKTLKGKVQPIRGPNVPYGGTTTMDVAGRFVRSKLNPTAGIAANLITQSDIIGRPLTVGGMVGGVFPIGWQDTLSAIKENGIPAGTALGVLSLLGEGVQVYNEEPKPTKR